MRLAAAPAWPRSWHRCSTARRRSCDLLLQCRGDGIVIAERQYPLADDLAAFMTLAGNQQDVARCKRLDGGANRFAAVANLDRAGRGLEYRGADGGRIFAARIVV